jgi:exodeoxyribonuclease V alpha subunit
MHRGDLGAGNINLLLQEALSGSAPASASLTRGARTFRAGDKVIQLRNDYDKEVFNGDVGRITAMKLDAASDEDKHVAVEIDGREILYALSELDQLGHAYALSVHKSQGSEYPAVVVPLVTQHYMLLQRNLLYTAITRGKKLVVLVGSKKALGLAVRNNDTRLRWTWLAQRIQDATRGVGGGGGVG